LMVLGISSGPLVPELFIRFSQARFSMVIPGG
jgi:hypothetical protein